MYSFQPLPPPNTGHDGFLFVVTVLALIVVYTLYEAEHRITRIWMFVVCFAIGGCTYNQSYNATYVYPKNQKVLGKFIGYVPEGYSERSGKSTVDVHYIYVMYEVPEGRILMRASSGLAYPPIAVLYKN